MIDLNAEIEKAKSTLEAAGVAFQRHATKFDNQQNDDDEQKLDKTRKIVNVDLTPEKPKPKTFFIKLPKIMQAEETEAVQPASKSGKRMINSLIGTNEIADPMDTIALQPIKRKFMKRKKSVSF